MRYKLAQLLLIVVLTIISLFAHNAEAATLTLTWADNSDNEDGFNIERKTGVNGSYTSIASVGPGTTSYSDSGLADSTTYCYRVNAFNGAGSSPYSPEVCGTTPAAPVTTPTLTVSVQGSGTVMSSPAGINCGSTCSATFASGTTVTLNALPASGYSFSAWSGDPDCLDGSITLNVNKTCTATFVRNSVSTATLTVNVVGAVSNGGAGKGSVISTPAGINCDSSCKANFPIGTTVTLTANVAPGSIFAGWSGDADCSDGVVTLGASKSCRAKFAARGNQLNVIFRGNGRGHVIGNPGSLDCVTDCSATFTAPTRVALRVIPALGSRFTGWSGDPDCSKGVVAVNGSASCTANFDQRPASIGLFDTTTHEWRLKSTLASANNGCTIDPCYPWQKKISGLGSQWIPIVGDWNTSGTDDLGIYSPSESSAKGSRWYLDRNGNDKWNGCDRDKCFRSFGLREDLPVIGDWNGTGKAKIAVFRPSTAEWFLDLDGDGKFDGCTIDRCIAGFGQSGDLPVAGDWDDSGISKIGLFRPSTGEWFLDMNSNGQWDGCNVDACIAFGVSGDLPVVGDWDASGASKIGVFRPSTGEWFLDMNGNGQWDGASADKYISGFGRPGDLPVAGKW